MVKAGQLLFSFDDSPLRARLEVARQGLAGAEAEYRQAAQQALSDSRSKSQLAMLTAKAEERRAEVSYLGGQLERASVLAPQDGLVLLDDPAEWIGRPVTVGERILRVATPGDVEVEAWLALGDAIPFDPAAPVTLYLNASPLDPVQARLRYVAHDAVQRADGSYAYRVRATLDAPSAHRVGLKGTAKLAGERVSLLYWIGRRPLAAIRQAIGY
jgi:multidrug resistance efflux pump